MNERTSKVLAYAPDAQVQTDAQLLAEPAKWRDLYLAGPSVWGEHKTYKVQIDLTDPAFNCTCPSKKRPCKHAVALYLLYTNQPNVFQQGTPPQWVDEWIAKRNTKRQQVAAKNAPKDAAAAAKRADARTERVTEGLNDLELWIHDMLRGGLAAALSQPRSYWENAARRLNDAQAPGVARMVTDIGELAAVGKGSQEKAVESMLADLSKIHLLIQAFRKLDDLPEARQADVRSLIGWTTDKETLFPLTGIRDHWWVASRTVTQDDNLKVQRTWIYGAKSARAALILSFAAGGAPLDRTLAPGAIFEGEIVYYPGMVSIRAEVKARLGLRNFQPLRGHADFTGLFTAYADVLALNPWIESIPAFLEKVIPTREGLRDSADRAVKFSPRFHRVWDLLAISGGCPVALFGEWDGTSFLPLCAIAENQYYPLWDLD
jgi:hypothetical protein